MISELILNLQLVISYLHIAIVHTLYKDNIHRVTNEIERYVSETQSINAENENLIKRSSTFVAKTFDVGSWSIVADKMRLIQKCNKKITASSQTSHNIYF